ncbi:phenylalanine--tRNA ligase subunit beta [Candidatus Micrarchaeota archaeon]|nr:phenylalanine--tRNA ligase subunit beta [Candidatus Micrarchaeota archaeon]
MATVTFDSKELCELIGKKLSTQQLEETLTNIGAPVDAISEKEVTADVTPDRLDFLSVEGIARAASSFLSIKKGLREYKVKESGHAVKIEESVASIRPFIVAAFVKEIKLDEQLLLPLMHVQEKMHETYGRKRRKASIGIHDADKAKPPFVYKAVAPESVSFTPLDASDEMNLREILEQHQKGIDYAFVLEKIEFDRKSVECSTSRRGDSSMKKYPLVVDSEENVLSFPPIINGELTRVTSETKNLLIEVTGTSLPAVNDVLNAVCAALADRGGKIESLRIGKQATPNLSPKKMKLDLEFANKVLGVEFTPRQATELLERMGFEAKGQKELDVLVPAYRADVLHEIDVVEDIAIAFGYNNFEPILPQLATIGKIAEEYNAARQTLTGLGFLETVNNTLTNKQDNFTKMQVEVHACTEIANPITEEYAIFRTWITPSLLQVFSRNKHEQFPQKIFEIGTTANERGETRKKLAVAFTDAQATFSQIKTIAETLLRELEVECEIKAFEHPAFIKGRSASIKTKGKTIGVIGEIHPQVLENFKLEQPTTTLEIELE